jgi:pyruvate/2-oxoglutarate/acetoin dehydrogenase E1 component
MQYEAFSYPALDQVLSHVSRYRWRSGGAIEMPMVIRMPYGGGVRAPELHEDSPEAYYAHAPGIKVAMPSTAADAKGLITAAIRDPDPVVVLEPKALYRASAEPVPDGEHFVELGRAVVARHGTDATVISYGAMLPVATAAAEQLAERDEAEVEVLDLRTLTPLDEDAVLDSVAKTGRAVIVHEAPRTAGFGAEVAALLAERGILDLRAPVRRVTGYDVPYPYWSLEDSYIPSIERVVRALEEVLRF